MSEWKPIGGSDWAELFASQWAELDPIQRDRFEQVRVPFWKATIRRSNVMGDEFVFVVAQKDDGVLYFDDVEYGFNIAVIDSDGRIQRPGGSQNTLREALEQWFGRERSLPTK